MDSITSRETLTVLRDMCTVGIFPLAAHRRIVVRERPRMVDVSENVYRFFPGIMITSNVIWPQSKYPLKSAYILLFPRIYSHNITLSSIYLYILKKIIKIIQKVAGLFLIVCNLWQLIQKLFKNRGIFLIVYYILAIYLRNFLKLIAITLCNAIYFKKTMRKLLKINEI